MTLVWLQNLAGEVTRELAVDPQYLYETLLLQSDATRMFHLFRDGAELQLDDMLEPSDVVTIVYEGERVYLSVYYECEPAGECDRVTATLYENSSQTEYELCQFYIRRQDDTELFFKEPYCPGMTKEQFFCNVPLKSNHYTELLCFKSHLRELMERSWAPNGEDLLFLGEESEDDDVNIVD